MKKASRSAAKAPPRRKKAAPVRRLVLAKPEAISPEEVDHLENIARRYEASEKAWQRMTSPAEDQDHWNSVEEHLLQGRSDSERRWKFFSK